VATPAGSAFTCRFLLFFFPDTEDCELGTDRFAEIAVDTLAFLHGNGRVISLDVEFLGQHENFLGTILHTETAALAAVLHDVELALGDFELGDVERCAPELHFQNLLDLCKALSEGVSVSGEKK